MKMVNGREIPDIVGELTNQEGMNMLADLLGECANAFSTSVDGDSLLLTSLSVSGESTLTGLVTATAGMTVGAAGTLTLNGATAGAIDFTDATPAYSAYTIAGTGGRNHPFIKIGSWDDPAVWTQSADHMVPIQVNITKSGNIAFDTAAARFKVATGAAQATSAIGCLQLRQTLGHNLASSAILNASANISANVTVGTGSILGGYFSLEGSGVVTKAGDNDISVLEAVNNNTGGGIDNVGIFLQNGTGTNVVEIVKIGVTNGTASCGLKFDGTMDKGIDFSEMSPDYADADDAFIAVGTWNDAFTVSSQVEHFVPYQANLISNTSVAKDIAAMRLRVDTSAANTLNYLAVQEIRSSVSHDCAAIGTFGAGLSIDGNIAIQTGEVVCGGFSIAGSGTVTAAGSNLCTVLQACNWNTSATESVTHVAHFFQNGAGSTVRAILQLEAIAGTATTGLNIPKGAGTLTTGIAVGATGANALVLTTYAQSAMKVFTTSPSADGGNTVEPVVIDATMTGAGGVGRALRANLTTNVELGGWSNAFKAYVNCQTNGHASGLLSAACLEMTLPGSDVYSTHGTATLLELEMVAPENFVANGMCSMIWGALTGDTTAVASFNANGNFLDISGFTDSGTNILHTNTAGAATHGLRCKINGILYDIMLVESAYS